MAKHLLFLTTFMVAAWSGPAGAQASAPCTADCAAPVAMPTGSASFTFADWAGPQITVWTHVPTGIDPASAPIAIILHGANRNPDEYRDAWADEAEKGGFIVVAPGFPASDFPGLNGYAAGGVLDEAGQPRPRALWAFSVIEPLFDAVVAKLGGSQTQYTIYGHSAGSQFVHRFLYFMPDARVKRYLSANAGWYTMPDLSIAFPFGLDGTPITEERLRAALAKDVVILLGDRDTDSEHRLLNRSREAMKQGRHRFARGQAYFDAARKLAKKNGWDFGWRLRVVEGVAHSNSGMAEGSWDLID